MMRGGREQQQRVFSPTKESTPVAKEEVWEVRPGGMLVQKRSPDADPPQPVPTIRVKVKFDGAYHEIYINAQASFGELKKLLSEKTGLHPDDQKVVYKDRERESKAFLDVAGVKDRSKMVMLEDPAAKAKRLLEERRTGKAQRAAKAVARATVDVDKLASKVSALETIVSKGGKVVDADVVALTEALMNELVKLDSVAADGEAKAQRRVQEKRVQKYVETLDAIRAKNRACAAAPRARASNGQQQAKARPPHLPPRPPPPSQQQRRQFQPPAPTTGTAPAPQTAASWETFDLLSSVPSTSAAPVTTMAPAMTATTTTPTTPRFEWELF